MRISADCIDQESVHEKENQKHLGDCNPIDETGKMATNKMSNNNNNDDDSAQNDLNSKGKSFYFIEESWNWRWGWMRLTITPLLSTDKTVGDCYTWDGIKDIIINKITEKNGKNVLQGITLVGLIGDESTHLPLNNDQDYLSAVKAAEFCGKQLRVTIKDANNELIRNDFEIFLKHAPNLGAIPKIRHLEHDLAEFDVANMMIMQPEQFQRYSKEREKKEKKIEELKEEYTSGVVMTKTAFDKLKEEITKDVTERVMENVNAKLNERSPRSSNFTPLYPTTTPSWNPNILPNGDVILNKYGNNRCGRNSNLRNFKNSIRRHLETLNAQNPLPILNEFGMDLNDSYLVRNVSEKKDIPEKNAATEKKVVHVGVICDNCDCQIEGIRYKCSNCLDYDLCEKCEVLADSVHDEDHIFLKMRKPVKVNANIHKTISNLTNRDKNDVYVYLDVDLPPNVNPHDVKVVPSLSIGKQNSSVQVNKETCKEMKNSSKFKISDHSKKKLAKKIEKMKHKSAAYSNLIQNHEERLVKFDNLPIGKSSISSSNSINQSSKTLYLSGMFVSDETIPDLTRMAPGTKFKKTWKVRNTGSKVWSARTTLRYVWGNAELEPCNNIKEIQVPPLKPGEEGRISIPFISPKSSVLAFYQSHWRLHHRGQPFGQRLVCKIIVDPKLAADQLVYHSAMSSKAAKTKEESIAIDKISQKPDLVLLDDDDPSQESKKLHTTPNSEFENLITKTEMVKERAKKLEKALTAVKEIRFTLNDNEPIPMKSYVKSHTATPANTPFDVSPPKSPEPLDLSKNLDLTNGNEEEEKSFVQVSEKGEVATSPTSSQEQESNVELDRNDSISLLSLSSDSSDEFVVVPLPPCFDLNVPFEDGDHLTRASDIETIHDDKVNSFAALKNCNDGNVSSSSFEVMNKVGLNENEDNFDEAVENLFTNDHCYAKNFQEFVKLEELEKRMQNVSLNESTVNATQNIESPIEENKHEEEIKEQNDSAAIGNQTSNTNTSGPQSPSSGFNYQKSTTFNPSNNQNENIIHVLPESLVTGALSAAAHVYNNVSRALFSNRNDGYDSRHFPWVTTSPPPAAIPMPDFFGNLVHREQPSTNGNFGTFNNENNNNGSNVSATETTSSQLTTNLDALFKQTTALKKLKEMGFWNGELNMKILKKNNYDVNDTVEELLNPSEREIRRKQRARARPSASASASASASEVVSHQPEPTGNHNVNNNLVEFD